MTEEKIVTKNPFGKTGRSINKQTYDTMKQAIIRALQDKELTHTKLMQAIIADLQGRFQGNISWYGETVKLDLEARQIIERSSGKITTYKLK